MGLKKVLYASHHDDTDTDADPADDVQFVVEHLVDGGRTALIERGKEERHEVTAPAHYGHGNVL